MNIDELEVPLPETERVEEAFRSMPYVVSDDDEVTVEAPNSAEREMHPFNQSEIDFITPKL
jgi:hypothetical protein